MIVGENCLGLFLDYPGRIRWDIGYTKQDELLITLQTPDFDAYVFTPETGEKRNPEAMITELRRLTGRSYIPPKWAFGFSQSRWGYMCENDVREVVRRHRENGLPLDSVCLDIDYMERYKDFTVDKSRFPDLKEFSEEMRKQHVRLVPIIDAGVKVENGYDVYEEGVENGYFCNGEDGKPFVVGVWPGRSVFPDVLKPEAACWFGDHYKILTDQGIEGFWNDMNEPAVFYSEGHLKEIFASLLEFNKLNLDVNSFFAMTETVSRAANRNEDYESFYHEIDNKHVRHDLVHNLFGFHMTKAAAEAFTRIRPNRRTLLYSRASYIGMHRYSGIWYGDNRAWWSQLQMNAKETANANMMGFLYSGADIGGFGSDTTPDLMLRWTAFGIFSPLFRNHSERNVREREYYRFDEIADFRNLLRIRYVLLPYIYSEFMKAALTDGVYIRPLGFVFPEDWLAVETEDQVYVGDSMMIAPVVLQNVSGRMVYLPEEMRLFRLRSIEDYDTEPLGKGYHYIKCSQNEVLLFVRKGHAVIYTSPSEWVREIEEDQLRALKFDDEPVSYLYYDDDGESTDTSMDNAHWIIL